MSTNPVLSYSGKNELSKNRFKTSCYLIYMYICVNYPIYQMLLIVNIKAILKFNYLTSMFASSISLIQTWKIRLFKGRWVERRTRLWMPVISYQNVCRVVGGRVRYDNVHQEIHIPYGTYNETCIQVGCFWVPFVSSSYGCCEVFFTNILQWSRIETNRGTVLQVNHPLRAYWMRGMK